MKESEGRAERYLVEYCSPTLASLKMANLFHYRITEGETLEDALAIWKKEILGKGIEILVLKRCEDSALIYVVRVSKLKKLLQDPAVQDFLRTFGYNDFSAEAVMDRLKVRLAVGGDFPHEIGIFLGYPIGDVIGFIQNRGRNGKCVGSWTVYCNEKEAVREFERFRKCKNIYLRLFLEGRNITQLTVAG